MFTEVYLRKTKKSWENMEKNAKKKYSEEGKQKKNDYMKEYLKEYWQKLTKHYVEENKRNRWVKSAEID